MKKHFNSLLSLKKEKKLTEEYVSGLSSSKLAKKYGFRSHVSVLKILKKHKIVRRTISESLVDSSHARKHKFNESFFDVIDTQNKAYLLGLMLTDGWVHNKRCEYSVAISSIDKQIILFFKRALKARSSPIYLRPKRKETHSQQFALSLSSKRLFLALSQYGCVPNKTFSVFYPSQVPVELASHFIRGLIDGDGSVRKYSRRSISINLSGTRGLLETVSQTLEERCGANGQIHPHGSIWRLFFFRDAKKVRDYIYKDAYFSLSRKKKIAFSV